MKARRNWAEPVKRIPGPIFVRVITAKMDLGRVEHRLPRFDALGRTDGGRGRGAGAGGVAEAADEIIH
jgi:hypothetical protein